MALTDILKYSENRTFVDHFMHMFITLWHKKYDLPQNRSQLVCIEVKSGSTNVKQSVDEFHR